MKIFYSLFISASLLVAGTSYAQHDWCGTDHHYNDLINANPSLKSKVEKEQDWLFDQARGMGGNKSGNLITIPVVVHIIHDNGIGNITDEQVKDGIRVLNEDFQRLNKDTSATRSVFKPYAADVGIQFKLARIDPNGKCTNGIIRINSDQTYEARDNVKALSYWPSNKYLNVWLVKTIQSFSTTGITLGYAQFPYWGVDNTYGLVSRNDYWGTIGTSNSDGRTATHEVGHCLGLFHTFQSGCGWNCSNSGDEICDTPPTAENTFTCNASQNTCSNDGIGFGSPFSTNVVDQIENYMSYDDCQNMFTIDQKDVMVSVFSSISALANLVSQPNLVATGTDSAYVPQICAPIAEFVYPEEIICETQSVKFTDISYNGAISTRMWSFPGGTPSSSTDSVVTVIYNTVGIYNATLTVTNSAGSNTKTHNSVVEVKTGKAQFANYFYGEGLEDTSFASNWTVINNGGSRRWEVTSDAAYTGNNSLYIHNFTGNPAGSIDEFISPTYDLSAVLNPELYFKMAYRRRVSSNADQLKVHYSTDCGQSWVTRFARSGDRLQTVPPENAEFIPQSADDWKEINVTFLASAKGSKNVMFRFEFIGDGGNNIYIDDIFIKNPTGIDELNKADARMNIYPNPTNGNCQLSMDLEESLNKVTITLTDIGGREVSTIMFERSLQEGLHQFDINTASLAKGLYFVNFISEKGRTTEKLIVN